MQSSATDCKSQPAIRGLLLINRHIASNRLLALLTLFLLGPFTSCSRLLRAGFVVVHEQGVPPVVQAVGRSCQVPASIQSSKLPRIVFS